MNKANSIITACLSLVGVAYGTDATGGGFALPSQSASAMGNALGGGAASAEDAGAMWFNPAAMPVLGSGLHLVQAVHRIKPSFKYRDEGSQGVFARPGTGEGGDGGHTALIPQLFFVRSITDNLWLGLGVNGTFGLETEYDGGWRGQAVALKSTSRAQNVNLAAGYKIDERFSVGLGANYQRFKVQLIRDTGPAPGVGLIDLDAGDSTFGWNAGLMFRPDQHTRLGLAYRSRMAYDLGGTATFSGNMALNRSVNANVTLPESASLSVFAELSSRWDVMADVTLTRWSRLGTVAIVPTVALPSPTLLPPLEFEWKDTLRLGVGVNYKPGNAWKLRAGIAYDPTPSKDETRTPQLPDQDRLFLAVGMQYNTGRFGKLDISYLHQVIRDAKVNVRPDRAATFGIPSSLTGSFNNKVGILSIQLGITL